jgi:hypothetical protein
MTAEEELMSVCAALKADERVSPVGKGLVTRLLRWVERELEAGKPARAILNVGDTDFCREPDLGSKSLAVWRRHVPSLLQRLCIENQKKSDKSKLM